MRRTTTNPEAFWFWAFGLSAIAAVLWPTPLVIALAVVSFVVVLTCFSR
jgi:uncharacterized membrane protein